MLVILEPLSYRIVIAYYRGFVPPKHINMLVAQGGSLMQAYMYANGAKRVTRAAPDQENIVLH